MFTKSPSKPTLNTNQQELALILSDAKPRVSTGKSSPKTTKAQPSHFVFARESLEHNEEPTDQLPHLHLLLKEATLKLTVRDINRFMNRQSNLVSPAEQYIGFVLLLVLALVSDSVPLSHDKSTILDGSWEGMKHILKNSGRALLDLNKLPVALENPMVIQQAKKFQLHRKIKSMKAKIMQEVLKMNSHTMAILALIDATATYYEHAKAVLQPVFKPPQTPQAFKKDMARLTPSKFTSPLKASKPPLSSAKKKKEGTPSVYQQLTDDRKKITRDLMKIETDHLIKLHEREAEN